MSDRNMTVTAMLNPSWTQKKVYAIGAIDTLKL